MDIKGYDKKTILKMMLCAFLAFAIAYFIDQYYINKKQMYFLIQPINTINKIFNSNSL
ncbi:MAG: hypothetical protein Q7R95_09460 [bacterium]|nr:hypothetical protein [bacterium]